VVGGLLGEGCGGVAPALIAHWNGTRWSVVPGTPQGLLRGVAAVNAHDIWAVGDGLDPGGLLLHWNGTRWSPSSLPTSNDYRSLLGVAAHGSRDVWAVGRTWVTQSGGTSAPQVAIFHWNGNAWSASAGVSPGSEEDALNGVATVASGEVWAVGYYAASFDSSQALIERYIP
jgi:hypothetical protein